MPRWRVSLAVGLLWQLSCFPNTDRFRVPGDAAAPDGADAAAAEAGGSATGGIDGSVVGAGGGSGQSGGQDGGPTGDASPPLRGGNGGIAAGGTTGGGMGGVTGTGGAAGTDTTAHDNFVGGWTVTGSTMLDCMGTQQTYSLQNSPMIVTTAGGENVALILEDCALVMRVLGNVATLVDEQQCNVVPPFGGDYLYQTGSFTVAGTTANLMRAGVANLMTSPFTPGGHCTFSERFTVTRDPP